MAMTVTVGLILLGVFWLLAPVLVGIFTPLEDVIKEGTRVFRISIFSFVVLGPQMLATTGIQAFGKARVALVLSLARQGLCYIPLLFIMQKTLGFEGLIWAQPVSDTVTLLLGIVFLWLILRKLLGRSVQEA